MCVYARIKDEKKQGKKLVKKKLVRYYINTIKYMQKKEWKIVGYRERRAKRSSWRNS